MSSYPVAQIPIGVTTMAPKGASKSGRPWKTKSKRHTAIIKVKPFHKSWAVKEAKRAALAAVKATEREMKESMNTAKREEREAIEARQAARAERQAAATIIQPIRNAAKVKAMNKKQLKRITTQANASKLGLGGKAETTASRAAQRGAARDAKAKRRARSRKQNK